MLPLTGSMQTCKTEGDRPFALLQPAAQSLSPLGAPSWKRNQSRIGSWRLLAPHVSYQRMTLRYHPQIITGAFAKLTFLTSGIKWLPARANHLVHDMTHFVTVLLVIDLACQQ